MKIIDRILFSITNNLPCRIINDGDRPYLERYYLFTLLGWTFYLHRFVGSDPNRGLHDHPWRKAYSVILSGWYWEETRMGTRKVRCFNSLTGDTFHRVVLPCKVMRNFYIEQGRRCFYDITLVNQPAPCWTLFFHTAGNVKKWGFLKPLDDSSYPDAAYFQPYMYTREGSQAEWWLTAPKGRAVRNGGRV